MNEEELNKIIVQYGTPTYVFDIRKVRERIENLLSYIECEFRSGL